MADYTFSTTVPLFQLAFTADAARIVIPGYAPSGEGAKEFTNTVLSDDPIVRAIAKEFAANGTTSGTISLIPAAVTPSGA